MADIGTVMNPSVNVVSADTPTWLTDFNKQISGAASGALTQMQNMPWQEAQTASLTPEQLQLIQQGQTAGGQWKPYFQQGTDMTNRAAGMLQGAAQWDPAEMQRHLSPYLSGVNDELARRGQQNFQNQLEQLNPAFTGGGAFGSSRWGEMNSRLANNNQREVLGQQSIAMNTAYDQAAKDYYNWGALEQKNASDLMNAGNNMFTAGTAAQTQGWNDIQNPFNMQEKYRANVQQGFDTQHEDWLRQIKQPFDVLGGLGTLQQNLNYPYVSNRTTLGTSTPANNNTLGDQIAAVLRGFAGGASNGIR